MNKEMKEATKQGKSQWIFFSQIMHKFSGCAGDGRAVKGSKVEFFCQLTFLINFD